VQISSKIINKGAFKMQPRILRISGSPIKNSNTDRLVQAVLKSSGLESEFVKLTALTSDPALPAKNVSRITFVK
jgi:hypothetical protein